MKKAVIFLILFQLVAGAVNGQNKQTVNRLDKKLEMLLQLPAEEIVARFKKHFHDTPEEDFFYLYRLAICSPQHCSRAYELLLADYQRPGISDEERSDALHTLSKGLRLSKVLNDKIENILVQAAADKSPRIRETALSEIRYITSNPKPETRLAIRKALYDPSSSIIYEALLNLKEFPDMEAVDRIVEILSNPQKLKPDEKIKLWGIPTDKLSRLALETLGDMGYPKLIPDFVNLLNSGKLSIQLDAMGWLGKCGANLSQEERHNVARKIRPWLSNPLEKIRVMTACTLARLGDASGTGVIMWYLLRPSALCRDDYKYHCVESVEKLTGQGWGKELFMDPLDAWDPGKKPILDQKINEIKAYLNMHGHLISIPQINYTLSAREEELFSRLFEIGLFDPAGARRVKGEVWDRNCWGQETHIITLREEPANTVNGWLVSPNGLPYIVLDNLHEVPVPFDTEEIDFTAEVDAILNKEKKSGVSTLFEPPRDNEITIHNPILKYIFWSAWLYKLGHKELAGRLYFVARYEFEDEESIFEAVKRELAWQEYNQAVNAYIVGADQEALVHAFRLNERYTELADEFGQGKTLLKELLRRKEERTFGKISGDLPPELNQWPQEKRVTYLIRSLEHLSQRQWAFSVWDRWTFINLEKDKMVQALIQSGDAAVPALIDCIDEDHRLTRSMYFVSDSDNHRTIISVKDAALTAVKSILKTNVFSPTCTRGHFTSMDGDTAKSTAQKLREYWAVYGKIPFLERMMKVLTAPHSSFEARREAARNLASSIGKRTLREIIPLSPEKITIEMIFFPPYFFKTQHKEKALDPMIEKFTGLTVAEAILEVMDMDLATLDNREDIDDMYDYNRHNLEDTYINCLINLADKRIVPKLKLRCAKAESLRMRRKLAYALFTLDFSEPWETFVHDFISGKITLPQNGLENLSEEDQPGTREFNDIIDSIIRAALCENKANYNALCILTDPGNKLYNLVLEQIYKHGLHHNRRERLCVYHPFCLKILRHELDNREDYGLSFEFKDGVLKYECKSCSCTIHMPDDLAKPELCKDSSKARYCDLAAMTLTEIVFGLDKYYPIFKDTEERLQRIRRFVDLYNGRLRQITSLEHKTLQIPYSDDYHFIPSIQPLGRPATPDDVTAGNAVFSLNGTGRLSDDTKLPAIATLYSENKCYKIRVVVVQIEIDSDGKKHYGIIASNGVYQVSEKDIAEIKTYEQWESEIEEK